MRSCPKLFSNRRNFQNVCNCLTFVYHCLKTIKVIHLKQAPNIQTRRSRYEFCSNESENRPHFRNFDHKNDLIDVRLRNIYIYISIMHNIENPL